MLSYAAIIPHPPFVIEGLKQHQGEALEKTIYAMKTVGEDLLSLDIDTVVLLTIHGERYENALSIALHDPFVASLHEFGDLRGKVEYRPDFRLADKIKRAVRLSARPVTMTTNETLDHATSIPLIFLKEYLQGMRVLVLTAPVDSSRTLLGLGVVVREAINDVHGRVAVLAVAELSQRLSELSLGGVHPHSQMFDESIRTALKDGNSMPILKPTFQEMEMIGGQELDAIRLFWGILDETEHRMEERCYEHPLGIGHLTMVAHIK
ncbi:TPA: hypothetical protein DEB00_00010 [Candidatus Uhrbacteria bacterium]|nr:hypothetical protein [Candidatus Uhrbacteria bacterium]